MVYAWGFKKKADRDPSLFGSVLTYLREGPPVAKEMDNVVGLPPRRWHPSEKCKHGLGHFLGGGLADLASELYLVAVHPPRVSHLA